MAIIYQGGQSMPAYGTAAYNAQFTKPTTTTTTKAATTPSTTGSTSGGYWTEGKVVNGVNIGGGVYVPPTTTPTSVAQTNPVSTIKTPVTSPTTGSVSGANATTEAITSLVKSLEEQAAQYKKEADAIAKQQAENSKSILDYFKSAKTPEQAKIEAQKEVGFAPADYFAQQKAGLAEIKSLSDRYAAMEAAKMQQIAQVEGSMASTNFRNNQIAQINRNAAPEMNLLSAQINSKTAVMAAEQGMFNEARQYVAQAVRDATADTEFKLNTMKMFYDMNQDTLDRIDTKYKEALELSISEEQRKLENERNAASDYYNNLAKIKPDIFGSAEGGYFEQYYNQSTGRWETRPVTGGTGGGGQGGQQSWTDIMQEAINQGATPEQAAREAAMASSNLGINVTQKNITEWTEQARRMTKMASGSSTTTEVKTRKVPVYSDLGNIMYYRDEEIKNTTPPLDLSKVGSGITFSNQTPFSTSPNLVGSFYSSLFDL